MMMNRDGQEQLERNERIGALLREAAPAGELLSWQCIETVVAAAPPVRLPWYATLAKSPAPLRYALAPFTLIFMLTIALSVIPAQSEQIGTLVATQLPPLWEADLAAFNEVQASAQAEFAKLELPQGDLLLFTVPRAGRDNLVLAMLGATTPQAAGVMQRLNQRYPMLAALEQEHIDIKSSPSGSRLSQLAAQVRHGAARGQDANTVTQQVLGALHSAGLSNLDVNYDPQADGSVVVTIEGEFSMQVSGHTQEERASQPGGPASGTAQAEELLRMLGAAQD